MQFIGQIMAENFYSIINQMFKLLQPKAFVTKKKTKETLTHPTSFRRDGQTDYNNVFCIYFPLQVLVIIDKLST